MDNRTEIYLSWSTFWKALFMLVLVVALFLARDVLIILFLAIVVSSALDGLVSFLENKRIPRILGALFIFIVGFSSLALVLYTIIPLGIVDLKNFLENLRNVNLPVFGSIDTTFLVQNIDEHLGGLADNLFSGGVSFVNFLARIFGNILLLVTVLILSFYLTVSRSGAERFLRAILPVTYETYIVDVYFRVRKKLGYWLQGQLILMLVVGMAVFFGLWLLGVKYSLSLGILAGILEIVPVAGPIFAGTLAFLMAVSESWVLGFYVVILFVIIQQVENHLLVPLIMRKTVGMSPVVVVVALLAGYKIAGIIGIILAVPVAVVLQELIEDWEKRKLRAKNNRLEI